MLWDVFISHASEDKEEVARPLATLLQDKGLRVWFSLRLDSTELRVAVRIRAQVQFLPTSLLRTGARATNFRRAAARYR